MSSTSWSYNSSPISALKFSLSNSYVVSAALFEPPTETALNIEIFLVSLSYTPLNLLPEPIGQLIGHVLIPRTFSISSRSSYGSLASKSILLIKVKIGICLITQTLKSLIVCASTPFEASITITAESAAINVL